MTIGGKGRKPPKGGGKISKMAVYPGEGPGTPKKRRSRRDKK